MILEAIGLVVVIGYAAVMLWAVYEVATMPPDDERWEIIAESMQEDRDDPSVPYYD